MALETGTYISDLVTTNPASTDQKSQGDDHLRLLKSTITATFPNITGAMTSTHTELNILDGATVTTAELNILDGVTSTAAELNILDGATLTVAELNRLDGITGPAAAKDGETYTGTHDYTGATVNVDTQSAGATGSEAASLDFVNAVAVSPALPGQTGNAGKMLNTDGTNASWTAEFNTTVNDFVDGSDATKKLAFDVSNIATATTRTLTMPDRDITLGSEYGYVLLSTYDLASVASVDVEWTAGTYTNFLIVADNLTSSSGSGSTISAALKVGGAYATGNVYKLYTVYDVMGSAESSAVATNPSGPPIINVVAAWVNTAPNSPGSFSLNINSADNTSLHVFNYRSMIFGGGSLYRHAYGAAQCDTAGALTGVRFTAPFLTGTVRLFGIRNA